MERLDINLNGDDEWHGADGRIVGVRLVNGVTASGQPGVAITIMTENNEEVVGITTSKLFATMAGAIQAGLEREQA